MITHVTVAQWSIGYWTLLKQYPRIKWSNHKRAQSCTTNENKLV